MGQQTAWCPVQHDIRQDTSAKAGGAVGVRVASPMGQKTTRETHLNLQWRPCRHAQRHDGHMEPASEQLDSAPASSTRRPCATAGFASMLDSTRQWSHRHRTDPSVDATRTSDCTDCASCLFGGILSCWTGHQAACWPICECHHQPAEGDSVDAVCMLRTADEDEPTCSSCAHGCSHLISRSTPGRVRLLRPDTSCHDITQQ